MENSDSSSQNQSLQNSKTKKYSKNTYQQKKSNINNKPMKILTFRKNEFSSNNINKRSNSSGANNNRCNISRNNNSGERLYQQYKIQLQRKEELKKKILEERAQEGNRKISPKPRIDPNSRRIVEKMRSNKKNEDKSKNYEYNKKQNNLIEKTNNGIKNKIKRPSKYNIDIKSSSVGNKNKNDRVYKSIDIEEEKKRRIKYKKIDLNKEFGKRNRSIGNEHSKKGNFINFGNPRNSNQAILYNNNNSYLSKTNKNTFKKNSNPTHGNNILIEENKSTISQLNKTLELNDAYKELYNSIDEKNENDISKYFRNYGVDLNSNLTENNIYSKEKNSSNIKNKNLHNEKRALTPPVYQAFDYLYYESEKKDKEKRKKQENYLKRNYPFNPRISPHTEKMKNKNKESNRISKNIEEIKIVNRSKINRNNKSNFQPIINMGPKSKIKREERINLDGMNEVDKEKNSLYSLKCKDIIMKKKIQKYKELFNLMDSNNDGFISNTEIKLTKIDKGILKNISPLLEELNQTKKRMNYKEFCIKMDKLMTEEKLEKNK